MNVSNEMLDHLETLAREATKWTPRQCELRRHADGSYYALQSAYIGDTLITLGDTYENSGTDWAFVAHANPDAVLALIDEVHWLRGLVKAAFVEGTRAATRGIHTAASEDHWWAQSLSRQSVEAR